MSIRIVERAVAGDNGEIGVRRAIFGKEVTVRWFCGETRTFTQQRLRTMIELVDVFAEDHPDVWLESCDTYGERFAVNVVNGQLHGNIGPNNDAANSVPWKSFRKALKKALD